MKVQNTRTALPDRFAHRAGFYSSRDEVIALATPIVAEALRQDMPVGLIVSDETERRLRQALDSSIGLIHLPPPEPALRASGQGVVTQRARELRELTDWAGPITVITEHHRDGVGVDASAWVEADAAMNVALAALPVTMTCLYPVELGSRALDAVRWNHPNLVDSGGVVRENLDARSPSEVLVMHPIAAPADLGRPDREMTFSPWQLIDLRTAVTEATETVGLPYDRAQDFVLAVNEVASNAVEHGHGIGRLRIWRRIDGLICEVHDTGSLGEPLPGLRPPHPNSPRGRGVWIARQLCDLLHVWTDPAGTHVRLRTLSR